MLRIGDNSTSAERQEQRWQINKYWLDKGQTGETK
jgi:hypothetical protein